MGKGCTRNTTCRTTSWPTCSSPWSRDLSWTGGLEPAKEFFSSTWCRRSSTPPRRHGNYKSVLQQLAQRQFGDTPKYCVLDEQGPDHNKCFKISPRSPAPATLPHGERIKKDAEQRAAMNAHRAMRGRAGPLPVRLSDQSLCPHIRFRATPPLRLGGEYKLPRWSDGVTSELKTVRIDVRKVLPACSGARERQRSAASRREKPGRAGHLPVERNGANQHLDRVIELETAFGRYPRRASSRARSRRHRRCGCNTRLTVSSSRSIANGLRM